MIKNKTFIEFEVKGRDYTFMCSPEAPLADAYEAVKLIEQYLVERLKVLPVDEQKQEDAQQEDK